ncbi:L10-interacting MYB domain-containing protein-like [Prunus avium]|uniref:L10-interacting MYB domain-containing protein-like n=1 Tax=Prunus avium TaxID=42229 RepID=A0A6P5TMG6_PRUAV|nr:L10-interacting MYB domain-containing protein-like [Prunus avium]
MSNNIVNPSQNESREEKEKQEKAKWDDKGTEVFIKICVAETLGGNRPSSHFNKVGWKNVIKKFNDITKRNYDYRQLKNKWTGLKKEWQLWTSLVAKETGLGWDPVKQTIKATDEWWDKKIKEKLEVARFRTHGLKHVDQLDILFKYVAVTGEGAWAPSQGFMVEDADNGPAIGEHNEEILVEEQDDFGYNSDVNADVNARLEDIVDVEPNNKRKRDSKRPGVGVKVTKRLDSILHAIENRSSTFKSKDKAGCSIGEVMQVVEGNP